VKRYVESIVIRCDFVSAHGIDPGRDSVGPRHRGQSVLYEPQAPKRNDCDTGEFVTRKIPSTKAVADTALRQLFAGPTSDEQTRGMQGIEPLGDYYIGVTVRKGTAIVNFRRGAEQYLHVTGPICIQDSVLTPIVKTLRQFPTIRNVDYAINGKIIEGWDA
jgi:spore germination protein GerM